MAVEVAEHPFVDAVISILRGAGGRPGQGDAAVGCRHHLQGLAGNAGPAAGDAAGAVQAIEDGVMQPADRLLFQRGQGRQVAGPSSFAIAVQVAGGGRVRLAHPLEAVVAFKRVQQQIVEFIVGGPADELEAPVTHGLAGVILGIGVGAKRRVGMRQQGQQAEAVPDAPVLRQPGCSQFEHGGHDVHGVHQGGGLHAAGAAAGVAHDERHVDAAFVEGALGPVGIERFPCHAPRRAVVTEEEHCGVRRNSSQETSDLSIHGLDGGQVAGSPKTAVAGRAR